VCKGLSKRALAHTQTSCYVGVVESLAVVVVAADAEMFLPYTVRPLISIIRHPSGSCKLPGFASFATFPVLMFCFCTCTRPSTVAERCASALLLYAKL
jgi:hypothetical protein